ncbi:hypothetical protein CPB85DRAFT_1278977 [Mucidula mucida]|nr:hypothetical protein CPB85DRAFT_1278977 [Mucidula mucida]
MVKLTSFLVLLGSQGFHTSSQVATQEPDTRPQSSVTSGRGFYSGTMGVTDMINEAKPFAETRAIVHLVYHDG